MHYDTENFIKMKNKLKNLHKHFENKLNSHDFYTLVMAAACELLIHESMYTFNNHENREQIWIALMDGLKNAGLQEINKIKEEDKNDRK